MRVDILTLFPDTVGDVLSESIIGRAQERGFIHIEAHQIRDYTANKQNQVDDYPYGGGRGAVMTADPLYRCWESVCDMASGPVHTIYMSPCGKTFTQADAIRLSKMDNLILVWGHYEGIDQRFIDECVDEYFTILNQELDTIHTDSRLQHLSSDCIFGTDANPRMARTAKMNMIMHGDGHGGVHHHDGLLNVNGIFENRFDVILTNPPFGSRVEKSLKILY